VSAQQVTRHLLERSQVRYSRASGPGGQHRDHTESRAELVIGRDALDGLPDHVAARLLDRLHLTKRPLRLASQNDRSRERNRATVERALLNRVEAALRPRTTRKATRPSASSVARRLDQKAARSRTKNLRRRPEAD
jgi:ribosome-associated protein